MATSEKGYHAPAHERPQSPNGYPRLVAEPGDAYQFGALL
jgi:hypothetical protein